MFKNILIQIIKLYQNTLSPDHGAPSSLFAQGFCQFRPTCSEYACDAIEDKGVIKGGYLAFRRVLKCHPWRNKITHDPVKQD